MTQDLTLMQAAVQKMHWHEARQKALAGNIANADTPGYKPQDIAPMDFKGLLESSTSSLPMAATGGGAVSTTNPMHFTSSGGLAGSATPKAKTQKDTYETSPTGNSVVLEEQLLKMNQNFTDHRLTTTIYQKSVEMMKSATK